jgi:hypothetical protein
MGIDELAGELGISPSTLRTWLRREFPRAPGERGRTWRLEDIQIDAARSRWRAADDLARAVTADRTADPAPGEVEGEGAAPPAVRERPLAAATDGASVAPADGPSPALAAPARRERAPEPEPEPAGALHVRPTSGRARRTVPPDLTAARLAEARRHTAEAASRARSRREAARAGHQPVSRAAEALAAGLALASLVAGILVRGAFADGPAAALGAGGGLIVAAIGLDLYARAVGAWAARDRPFVAVACALVGSPAVLGHALAARRGPLGFETGALAGLLVPVVCVVLVSASASG